MKPLSVGFLFFCLLLAPSALEAQDKVADGKFWAASTFLVGATIYDVESTYFALNRCEGGCKEGNPIMRPLIEKGRPWAYAFQGSMDAGVIYLGYNLKKRGHKIWYLPPVIVGAAHAAAGTWNIKFAMKF